MSYNKTLLQQITKDMQKATKPSVPRNQWQHPGEITKIPSPNITMEGVGFPVIGVPNVGTPQMMYPGNQYYFAGANSVTEFPQMKNGGGLLSKSVSCSSCGWSWKAIDGGSDPLTCHKCGGMVEMKNGGQLDQFQPGGSTQLANVNVKSKKKQPIYVTDKNDPRLRAYQDSLSLYNQSKNTEAEIAKIFANAYKREGFDKSTINRELFEGKDFVLHPEKYIKKEKGYVDSKLKEYNKKGLYYSSFPGEEYLGTPENPATIQNLIKYNTEDIKSRSPYVTGVDGNGLTQKERIKAASIANAGLQKQNDIIKRTGYNPTYFIPNGERPPTLIFKKPTQPVLYQERTYQTETPELQPLPIQGMDSSLPELQRIEGPSKWMRSFGAGANQNYWSKVDAYGTPLPGYYAPNQNAVEQPQGPGPEFGSGGQHGGLDRWFAEKWVDVKTGKACGRQEGEKRDGYPACRPSRRVNEDTPKTASELSSAEREKFKRSKTSSERINYQHRRKQYGGDMMNNDYDYSANFEFDPASAMMAKGGNVPTNPALWSRAKAAARAKYDVYPSAYANGWAAKWYKSKGGGWRKGEYGMEVMADGGTPDNPGFNALPESVQEKIIANMANGGAAQQAAIAIAMKAAGKKPQGQYADGGTNNEGFKALPPYVQAKILSNMANGGQMPEEIARARFAAAGNLDKMDDYGYAYGGYIPEYGSGGYTVTRSDDRKGKTHKVTGPDGTVKYFGDSKMGQHPSDPERKAAFYARHKKNLAGNPYFRAFARATWADGGELDQYQKAGETKGLLEKWIDSHNAEAAKNGPGWFDRSVMAVTEDLPNAISNTFSKKNILKAVDQGAAKVIRGARNLGIGVPEFVTEDIFNKIRPVSYPTDLSQAVAEYTRSDKAPPTRDLQGDLAMDEEAWSMNLGRNTKQKYIVPSQYKPSMSSDPNAKYHTFAPGIIDPQAVAKLVSDEAYWNKNKKVNKKGVEYLPMRTMEPIVSKQFMADYNKYKQMPFDQTDPMANFQIYRGVDPKTKKKYASISDVYDFGLESANAATNPINFYDRIYYKEGGENDREMVEGIANILAMVNDEENRAMIGGRMLRDFEDEDIDYNYEQFLKMAKLSKGKLPKAQVGLNLAPNQQSGYNWQNPFDQAEMNPFMPKQIIKKADGTTETRGTVGPGTMLFEQNTVGTPTAATPVTKKPKKDFFGTAYNNMMDQYTNPGSFMNILNVAGAAVNLATQGKRDRDFNSFLRERNASYNQAGNETIDRGNYSVNPSSYGLLQPQNMGVDSPEGQYNGGRFFSMQDGGSMDIAAKYTVPSIDAILDSNMMRGFDFAPRVAAPDASFVNKPVAAKPVQLSANLADLPLDADAMLATIGKQESSSKPGQNAVGLRTKLVGAGGKRGSASGTFQITDSTLRGIYNQHFDDQFNSFSQFKSAFDTNPQVEYSAAKALMNDHIKKYGIYALGAWYQPSFAARAAKGDMSVMNTIPAPEYGNRVTFGDYFNKSLKNYQKALGTMEEGGEYELTEAEIQQIRAMGGDVEFI